ncbi:hypothetical protein MKW92_017017 [Papaver armeniacum]|nr:hypothetical protein MKW92_017017 [Papaver armeniacum]
MRSYLHWLFICHCLEPICVACHRPAGCMHVLITFYPSSMQNHLLMRLTFPASSARVKAPERFEAAYPVLIEVAFTGSPGCKAKNITQQIFSSKL